MNASQAAALAPYVGRQAKVHWHVTRREYSVAVAGRVVAYVPSCRLAFARFHIDRRLRAAFIARTTRRTVHALVIGTLLSSDNICDDLHGELVCCNPFRYSTFVRASDEAPAVSATLVVLHPNKRIEAIGLRCSTPEKGSFMTFDEAEVKADFMRIDLAHDCDERAKECACTSDQLDYEGGDGGHTPGDVRCANRAKHSACSHDLEKFAAVLNLDRLRDIVAQAGIPGQIRLTGNGITLFCNYASDNEVAVGPGYFGRDLRTAFVYRNELSFGLCGNDESFQRASTDDTEETIARKVIAIATAQSGLGR